MTNDYSDLLAKAEAAIATTASISDEQSSLLKALDARSAFRLAASPDVIRALVEGLNQALKQSDALQDLAFEADDLRAQLVHRVQEHDALVLRLREAEEALRIIASGNDLYGDVSEDELVRLQKDCGTYSPPTQLTYHARLAPGGKGDLAFTWSDKPHRIVFDLCDRIEVAAAYFDTTEGGE